MCAYVIADKTTAKTSRRYIRELPFLSGSKYFRRFVSKEAGDDYSLMENLRKAHVDATAFEYHAWVLEMVFVLAAIAVAGSVVGFLLIHTYFVFMLLLAPVIFYYMSGGLPRQWQNAVKKGFVGINFIRFLSLFNVFVSSGVNLVEVFDRIGQAPGFGAIGEECRRIVTDVRNFAMDVTSAMQESATYSPSQQWSDLLGGIVAAQRSGSNVVDYVNGETFHANLEWEKEVQKITENLNIFSEIYATVGNAFPLFLIFLVGIMSALGAEGPGGPRETLVLALIIPTVLSGVFVWLFASSVREGFK